MLDRVRGFAGLHVDVGTGDGAFVLRTARANPGIFVVGVDANAEAMIDRSRRAASKPSRGGASNALFVHAPIEKLPEELEGLATRVTVLFPWGSLLRAVWSPDIGALASLRNLCAGGAELVIAVSASPRDAGFDRPFDGIDPDGARLPEAYARAGFDVRVRETAGPIHETTWSKRLSFGTDRRFFVLEGSARREGP